MTRQGADAVIAHVGTTVGGSIGVNHAVASWDHTVSVTQDIIDAARGVRKDVITLTHGGPINTPKDVEFILSKTSADGFVGASSLERMGVEHSLTALTREFKRVPVRG
jgi:predicted TIM-barrel enzyme